MKKLCVLLFALLGFAGCEPDESSEQPVAYGPPSAGYSSKTQAVVVDAEAHAGEILSGEADKTIEE